MLQRLKSLILKISIATMAFIPMMAATAHGQVNIQQNLCEGANLDIGNQTGCEENGAATTAVDNLLTDIINIFSIVVGVVSVIMIIIGGLKYITSGGDSGNVTGAKNTILYAVIGLVVVALAQIIVRFVLSRVSTT